MTSITAVPRWANAALRSGRSCFWSPENGVEAVRVGEEIGGRLARAADARELGHAMGLEARLVGGLDDPRGDRVVAAARAQRGLRAVVVGPREADAVPVARGRSAGGS